MSRKVEGENKKVEESSKRDSLGKKKEENGGWIRQKEEEEKKERIEGVKEMVREEAEKYGRKRGRSLHKLTIRKGIYI